MNQGYSFNAGLFPLKEEELDLYALAVLLQRVDDLPEPLCHQVEDSIAMQVAVVQRMQAMQTGFGVPAGYQARFEQLLAAHGNAKQTDRMRRASLIPLWTKRITMAAAVLLCFVGVWATVTVWFKPNGLIVGQIPPPGIPAPSATIAPEVVTVALDEPAPQPEPDLALSANEGTRRQLASTDSSPVASAETTKLSPAPKSLPSAPVQAETVATTVKSALKPLNTGATLGPPEIRGKSNKKITIAVSGDCLGRKAKKMEMSAVRFDYYCGATNEILGSQTVTDLKQLEALKWQVTMDNLLLPERDKLKIVWHVVPSAKSGIQPQSECLTGQEIVTPE